MIVIMGLLFAIVFLFLAVMGIVGMILFVGVLPCYEQFPI